MDRATDRAFAKLRREFVDRAAEPLALLAGRFAEPELARGIARLEVVGRNASQPDPAAAPGLDRDLRLQVDRGAREHAAIARALRERRPPGDLAEVVVLDDQRDRARSQLGRAQPRGDAVRLIEQDDAELALVLEVVLERLAMADRDGRALGDHRPRVLAASERREVLPGHHAEPADQRGLGIARDVADRREPHARERAAGRLADGPQPRRRQSVEERYEVLLGARAQAIRLVDIRGDLRRELDRRDADRRDELGLGRHALLARARDRHRVAEQAFAAGTVEERLVERQPLDLGRVVAEDLEEDVRGLDVALHPVLDDDRVRAAPHRLRHRHRALDPEHPRFVAARRDDAALDRATDEHGLAAQLRVVPLFDRRVERVEIDVQDGPHYFVNTCSFVTTEKNTNAKPPSNIDQAHDGTGFRLPCEYFLIRPRRMPCTGKMRSTIAVSFTWSQPLPGVENRLIGDTAIAMPHPIVTVAAISVASARARSCSVSCSCDDFGAWSWNR